MTQEIAGIWRNSTSDLKQLDFASFYSAQDRLPAFENRLHETEERHRSYEPLTDVSNGTEVKFGNFRLYDEHEPRSSSLRINCMLSFVPTSL